MRRIHRNYAKWRVLLFSCCLASSASAQTNASLLSADYSQPAPFLVAQGQIVTLFFRGVSPHPDGSLRIETSTNLPWLSTLAGISLRVSQSGLPAPVPVPILSVRQTNDCPDIGNSSPVCFLTAVRVQIPFELAASDTLRVGPNGKTAPVAELAVNEDGRASRSFFLQPITDNGHVVTSCDLAWDTRANSTCTGSAYHADGREVNADSPAKLGETLVVNAYGFGQTSPATKTGEPTIQGAAIPVAGQQRRVIVTFVDSFLNTSNSLPRRLIAEPFNAPPAPIEFAGLSPGQAGVYQLNVPVPTKLQIPVLCGPEGNIKQVSSNAILQVTTALGTENVPICIVP